MRIANDAAQRFPTGAQAKCADHEPGVAKDGLGLGQPLPFDAADEPPGRDVNILQEKGCGVAGPYAMLILWLAVAEARRILIDYEPGRAAGARASTVYKSATPPLLIHCFWPLIL